MERDGAYGRPLARYRVPTYLLFVGTSYRALGSCQNSTKDQKNDELFSAVRVKRDLK